jgi:hypothetical protein
METKCRGGEIRMQNLNGSFFIRIGIRIVTKQRVLKKVRRLFTCHDAQERVKEGTKGNYTK